MAASKSACCSLSDRGTDPFTKPIAREPMESVGLLLNVAGLFIVICSWIWLLVVAFQEGVLWGLGILVPILGLLFAILHFDIAGKPLLFNIGGAVLLFLGGYFSAG